MWRCLSCYMSLPSVPNLEARSEGGFGVLDVPVLLVLKLEETGLSPLLPFLFAAVCASGLGEVLPLSFDLSWLARALFAGASLVASDQCSDVKWQNTTWRSLENRS